jgi:hypothetical protein
VWHWVLVLFAIIRLSQKNLTEINALVYFSAEPVAKKKSVMTWGPGLQWKVPAGSFPVLGPDLPGLVPFPKFLHVQKRKFGAREFWHRRYKTVFHRQKSWTVCPRRAFQASLVCLTGASP